MRLLGSAVVVLALMQSLGCEGAISGGRSEPDPFPEPAPLTPGAEFRCDSDFADPGPATARRLTIPEYVSTLRAVLGVDVSSEASNLLPADIRADGFANTSGSLIVTLEHVQGYAQIAELAVSQIDVPALVAQHANCNDLSEGCARELIAELGLRFYRAPPSPDETDALLTNVWSAATVENANFEEAAGLLIEAMLQAPRFVYRLERMEGPGLAREVDGFEMASRLSYLIWGSAPDEELLGAAAADQLRTDDEIETQVRRMLQDPRAREAFSRFMNDWVHLDRLESLTRDETRFPDWTLELGRSMKQETLAFAEALVWDDARPLLDLFNDQRTFAELDLATHYGLENPAQGLQAYDLSGVPERGGLLTQGSLLTIGGNESSMVARGQFLLENVLCGRLDSPPPGVDTTPPEVEPGRSQRSYSEDRVESPSCGGCHAQMEPLAWGLERFDGAGVFVVEDQFGNGLQEDGNLLVPGGPEPEPFSSVGEMMDLLAANERVRDCVSLKTAQYALGRLLLESDGCSLADMRDRFVETDGTYQELLVAVALSPMLRTIRTQ